MAILFPIKIENQKFYVNPTKISIRKRSDIARVKTLSGTTFQTWPDLPDEVRFEGLCFGLRSLFELRNLQDSIVRRPENKEIKLTYKFRIYTGYIIDLEVSADADKPRQFNYSFSFISKKPIELSEMMLGQATGLKAEFDFIEAQLRGASMAIANIPATITADVLNVGNSIGMIGMNIERPLSPSIPSFRP